MKNKKLKVASLFSGSGGMDLGMVGDFKFLGRKYYRHPVEIIYAMDNDKHACDIYNANFGHKCQEADIRKVGYKDVAPHHILTGGFPCQSFSIVAQNPPRLGYKDETGRLFFEMCRILEKRKPLVFIAENVKGILSANKGKAFPLILDKFREAGYLVTYSVLNAADYGIPQKRERVFIVGFRKKKFLENFSFPRATTKTAKVPLEKVIEDGSKVEDKYYFSKRAVRGLKKANGKRSDMNKGRAQNIKDPCNTVGAHLAKVSLNSTDPVLMVDGRYRMFTPREVARIQSFPEEYELTGSKTRIYRALGNAVPPVLMWHVTRSIVKAIMDTDRKFFFSKPHRTKEEKRSLNMSQIKGKDTHIELKLRKALWSKGFRYSANTHEIFGKPDIVFKGQKVAIFCDSEFWHGKDFPNGISRIKTNGEYWREKIKNNIRRDTEVTKRLKQDGWQVLRFWSSEIHDSLDEVVNTVARYLM